MENTIYKDIIDDNCFVVKTNTNGTITYVNNIFCELSSYSQEELVGCNFSKLRAFDNTESFYKNLWDTISKKNTWKGIIKNVDKLDNEFYIKCSIYPILDDNNEIIEYMSFGTDISDYIGMIKYDDLTKLKSRSNLKKSIDNDKNYLCVVVNLDNFSDINEFYGGYYGDMVLVETAKRLQRVFMGSDIYRLQSDEFAILKVLPLNFDFSQYTEIAKNKLISIFDEVYILDEETDIHITATSGLSIGKLNNLRNANVALKNSKQNNINFSVYDEKMLDRFANFTNNKKIAGDIKKAIKDDQIIPYYQPIIDNKTREVVKYEALARLIKVDDVVSPGDFIDISKKIKYYHNITRAMLRRVFKDFGQNTDVGVSINLTIEDISNYRTFAIIAELLTQNVYNNHITFELVETDGIEDYDTFNRFVKTIRKFGAKISIDDFGTGYSNFSYLANIEPDYLKIDGSLIKNIQNTKDYDVVKTIINFAKMYNIKTVAEYVENEEIYNLVRKLGIDYSQGYYFSKPIAIEDIQESY